MAEQDKAVEEHRSDLIGIFAQHKVAANLLMAIMLILGAVALTKLNTQFFPSFEPEYISVRVSWPGASAEDVSASIVTPLEQELRNLDDVKEMTSTSSRGIGVITLEYNENSNMGLALDQVKEFVSLVRNLPSEAETPEVTRFAFRETVATLVVSSEQSLEELRSLVYDFERELLAKGISKINFTGLPEQEIAIQIPSRQIKNLGLSLPHIRERIANSSRDIPAGTSGKNDVARELRSVEQRRTAEGFENLALQTQNADARIFLGDIAEIERREKDGQVAVFYQDKPTVLMEVLRAESADTLESATTLNDWLIETRAKLPPSVSIEIYDERYGLIEDRIDLMLKNGLGGLVLVIAILFIFLNGRIAFWVTVGIPVSFMGTLAVLLVLGGSINMISLFALIMALGIIVDDAIVVGEDAMTHFQQGEGSLLAAEGGARRMFVPVLSSSMTTIAAFLPLMIVGDIIGKILFAIPLVIVCVIIASVIECFLILPGHLSHTLKKANPHPEADSWRAKFDERFNRFRDGPFRRAATFAVQQRFATIAAAFGILIFSFALMLSGRIGFSFFPQPESDKIIAGVKFSAGTPPEKVSAFADEMERALWQTNEELKSAEDLIIHAIKLKNVASFSGGGNSSSGEQYASMRVELLTPDAREIRNPEFIERWKSNLVMPDGIEQLSIASPRGGPPGKDVDVFLTGKEPVELKIAADALAEKLESYVGIRDIQDDLPYGKNQILYKLSPLGEALGLSVADVGNQLRAAYDGQIVQVFYDKNEEVEVRVMLPNAERDSARLLDNFPIVLPNGQTAPLTNVAEFSDQRGLEVLRHTNGLSGIRVTASVNPTLNNANVIQQDLRDNFLTQFSSDYGVQYEMKGRAQEQAETSADMKLGALIGLTMIYIILAWVFGSYSWPFAVIFAIPLGISGAILGHGLLGIDLTLLSMFGFFGLSGIVINDSIILVTFYRQLIEQGMAREKAIIEACCLRLRAVLLTSLTTVAGLLPLLFETSLQAQFLIPMAVSISFGLAFATLLILFVVPAQLSIIEDLRASIRRLLDKEDQMSSVERVQATDR